jgi:hypothetical protein
MARTNGTEAARRWLPMASRAAGLSEEAERRGIGRASTRGENGGGLSTAHPRAKIRLTSPCGVAATGAEVPYRCERGCRVVTSYIGGRAGPGTGQCGKKENGPLTIGPQANSFLFQNSNSAQTR